MCNILHLSNNNLSWQIRKSLICLCITLNCLVSFSFCFCHSNLCFSIAAICNILTVERCASIFLLLFLLFACDTQGSRYELTKQNIQKRISSVFIIKSISHICRHEECMKSITYITDNILQTAVVITLINKIFFLFTYISMSCISIQSNITFEHSKLVKIFRKIHLSR